MSLFECKMHAADTMLNSLACVFARTASRMLDCNALDRDPGETAGADRPLGLIECGFSTCGKHDLVLGGVLCVCPEPVLAK